MRILLTSPTYPPFNSGLGNAVSQQVAALTRAGHEVTVATGGESRSTRHVEGIRVEAFPISGSDYWLNPIRGDVVAYLDFIRQEAWDLVVLNAWQNWATDLALCHLEEISGKKIVYSHCVSTNVFFLQQPLRSLIRYITWRPYWWRLARQMKRLDGLLFLAGDGGDSRFDDLRLAKLLGIPYRVVPNTISAAAFSILERGSPPFEARDRLISVGSYQWQKGFDFVLRAYAASDARYHFPIHFYGQTFTPYVRKLRLLVRKLGVPEEMVVFHEGVSGVTLVDEYAKARLMLSGSHTECQPLVLIDANATGTPFVARMTGCVASMSGGVGIDSFQKMAHHIDRLTQDNRAWLKLANAGLDAAKGRYHPSRCGQLLEDALLGMCSS